GRRPASLPLGRACHRRQPVSVRRARARELRRRGSAGASRARSRRRRESHPRGRRHRPARRRRHDPKERRAAAARRAREPLAGEPMKSRSFLDEIGDVHALAGARIAFGVLLLVEARGMMLEQLDQGYFGAHFHVPFIPERFVPSQQVFAMILAAQAVCAVLVIVGHVARPALFFSAAAITYAMLCDRLHFHHNRWALACYAALLALTPCDRARALGARGGVPTAGPLWAVRLAQLQVCI